MRGHIRGRSKGSWAIVIDLERGADGERRQKWCTFKGTKRAAQDELARLIAEIKAGRHIEPDKATVAQYLERYLARLEETAGRSWHENCERHTRLHLIPRIGHIPLSKLSALHIEDCFRELRKSGNRRTGGALTARSMHQVQAFLHTALDQAVRWKLIGTNPAEAIDWPRLPRAEVHPLSINETRRLLEAARDTPLFIVILVAVTTGLRRGELLALRWEDVSLDRAELVVRRAIEQARGTLTEKGPKSASGIRRISLPAVAVAALRQHREEQRLQQLALGPMWQHHDLVCCQADGTLWSPQAISLRFMRLVRKLDIPRVRFHDLRHSHASHLLERGVHGKVVSERLGHAKISITLYIYSHLLPGIQEDAARRIDSAFAAPDEDRFPRSEEIR